MVNTDLLQTAMNSAKITGSELYLVYAIKKKEYDMTVNKEFAVQIFDVNFYITVHLDTNVHDEISSSVRVLITLKCMMWIIF